jgi:hypothetical protein
LVLSFADFGGPLNEGDIEELGWWRGNQGEGEGSDERPISSVLSLADFGGPLHEGDIEELGGRACVVCPWHAYAFCIETGDRIFQYLPSGTFVSLVRRSFFLGI